LGKKLGLGFGKGQSSEQDERPGRGGVAGRKEGEGVAINWELCCQGSHRMHWGWMGIGLWFQKHKKKPEKV